MLCCMRGIKLRERSERSHSLRDLNSNPRGSNLKKHLNVGGGRGQFSRIEAKWSVWGQPALRGESLGQPLFPDPSQQGSTTAVLESGCVERALAPRPVSSCSFTCMSTGMTGRLPGADTGWRLPEHAGPPSGSSQCTGIYTVGTKVEVGRCRLGAEGPGRPLGEVMPDGQSPCPVPGEADRREGGVPGSWPAALLRLGELPAHSSCSVSLSTPGLNKLSLKLLPLHTSRSSPNPQGIQALPRPLTRTLLQLKCPQESGWF